MNLARIPLLLKQETLSLVSTLEHEILQITMLMSSGMLKEFESEKQMAYSIFSPKNVHFMVNSSFFLFNLQLGMWVRVMKVFFKLNRSSSHKLLT